MENKNTTNPETMFKMKLCSTSKEIHELYYI